jgi:bifunctional DNA-binding transcriptional regulator/antitoxin component of YhaV-PrlF toxin-antitoxin module
MKRDIGIFREMDKLGRIVIPIEYRSAFKLENEVEILATDEGVLIRNPKYKVVLIDENDPNGQDVK